MEPLLSFDEAEAVIEPARIRQQVEGFPSVAVGAFSTQLMKLLAQDDSFHVISTVWEDINSFPIYQVEVRGIPLAVFSFRVGAPAAAMQLEEIYAMGAQGVVAYGCCGVLDKSIDASAVILPTSAVREEGTSYQYAPAAQEIAQDARSIELMAATFDRLGEPYVKGKTWTTDAIYRETRSKVEQRKQQGCICVEMECSALLAVSQYRKKRFAQFVYAADNLDGEEWDERTLGGLPSSARMRILGLALEIGVDMDKDIKGGI